MKDLCQARFDQLTAKQLVLGIWHVPKRNALPRPACQAAVDAREERELPRVGAVRGQTTSRQLQPLNVDRTAAPPRLEVLLELPGDHVWRARSSKMRPKDTRDIRGLLESLEERGEPTVANRRRILGEEGDMRAVGQSHDQVP